MLPCLLDEVALQQRPLNRSAAGMVLDPIERDWILEAANPS